MTRRSLSSFLLASPFAWAAKGSVLPAERRRYADPATEGEVIRLTDPAKASRLPRGVRRGNSSRGNFLLFSSDRGAGWQVYRMDLKTGESRQLTEARQLDPDSLLLSADERSVYYLDGGSLMAVGAREREVYKSGGQILTFQVTDDNLHALVAEADRLLLAPGLTKAPTRKLADGAAAEIQPRPRRASAVYRLGDQWFLAHLDGTVNRRLAFMDGAVGAQWSADGRTLLYLKGKDLLEADPDAGTEKPIARTSQFAGFARNGDGSVFVGVSASVAQPHVLLLLRSTKREFTLCEHKSSAKGLGGPLFSPNSQRIFYQSDRDGQPALYMVAVDKLVEKTEAS